MIQSSVDYQYQKQHILKALYKPQRLEVVKSNARSDMRFELALHDLLSTGQVLIAYSGNSSKQVAWLCTQLQLKDIPRLLAVVGQAKPRQLDSFEAQRKRQQKQDKLQQMRIEASLTAASEQRQQMRLEQMAAALDTIEYGWQQTENELNIQLKKNLGRRPKDQWDQLRSQHQAVVESAKQQYFEQEFFRRFQQPIPEGLR